MTTETRELVLKDFNLIREHIQRMLDETSVKTKYVEFPFVDSAGCMCKAVCNATTKTILGLKVPIAETGIVDANWLHPTTAYCDTIVYETIEL